MFVDYTQIRLDLKNLLVTNHPDDFETIKEEVDFNKLTFSNMPLADVRLVREISEVRAGQDYFVTLSLEIEILCADLSSFLETCNIRDNLVNLVKDTIRNNAHFSSVVESVILTGTEFSSAQDTNEGEFIAAAVIGLNVTIFTDR